MAEKTGVLDGKEEVGNDGECEEVEIRKEEVFVLERTPLSYS